MGIAERTVAARIIRKRQPLVFLLAWCAFAGPVAAKSIKEGEIYTSRTKLFRVTAPKGFGTFQVIEFGERKKPELGEEVVFRIKDWGELYRVGIRRISPEPASASTRESGDVPLPDLAIAAVQFHYGRAIPGAPKLKSEEALATPHGPGQAAVFEVEGGSQVASFSDPEELRALAQGQKATGQRRATHVAVVVVRKGDHVIYASAQNDGLSLGFSPLSGDPIGSVRAAAAGMIQSLTLLREPEK
jgi:hypothetical protein